MWPNCNTFKYVDTYKFLLPISILVVLLGLLVLLGTSTRGRIPRIGIHISNLIRFLVLGNLPALKRTRKQRQCFSRQCLLTCREKPTVNSLGPRLVPRLTSHTIVFANDLVGSQQHGTTRSLSRLSATLKEGNSKYNPKSSGQAQGQPVDFLLYKPVSTQVNVQHRPKSYQTENKTSPEVWGTNSAKVLTSAKARLACLATVGKVSAKKTSHFRELRVTKTRSTGCRYGRLGMTASPKLLSMTTPTLVNFFNPWMTAVRRIGPDTLIFLFFSDSPVGASWGGACPA